MEFASFSLYQDPIPRRRHRACAVITGTGLHGRFAMLGAIGGPRAGARAGACIKPMTLAALQGDRAAAEVLADALEEGADPGAAQWWRVFSAAMWCASDDDSAKPPIELIRIVSRLRGAFRAEARVDVEHAAEIRALALFVDMGVLTPEEVARFGGG
jgi:hypothetical protein